jgi:hypothetical protein
MSGPIAVKPPSTTNASPVTNPASSLARNNAVPAICFPCPYSGHGCIEASVLIASSGFPWLVNPVKIPPGQIAFTRILSGANCTAAAFVKLITAALAAEYTNGPEPPLRPAVDAVLIITPPCPCCFITRAAYLIPKKTPFTSTSNV